MPETEVAHEQTECPVCPHCGTVDQDWWDGLAGNRSDGSHWQATCSDCGRVHEVMMCVTTTFSTRAA